jgi:hypothetical protein
MLKKSLFLIFLAAIVTTFAYADIIKSGSIQAFSDGINITIRWTTENETNVTAFEILRSTSYNGGFVPIATVDPKGPSFYEFVDKSAFRRTATVYYYRIKVILSNGESYFPALNESPVSVNHSVSGVRRTWGSIKAMFR